MYFVLSYWAIDKRIKMNKLLIVGFIINSAFAFNQKSICGTEDNREVSQVSQVGRAVETEYGQNACTLTLISSSCALSAGHCYEVLGFAEFNTPLSIKGILQRSSYEDIYEVDQALTKYTDTGLGDDWAVVKLKENVVTKKLPGDVQGFLDVGYEEFQIGDEVRITGYGITSDPSTFQAQQTHTGKITGVGLLSSPWVSKPSAIINHQVDTTGGNSGSAIVHEASGKIIGIHTNAGCGYSGGYSNTGVNISKNQALVNAIKACLDSEKK